MLENMPININAFRPHQKYTAVFKDSSDNEVTKEVLFLSGDATRVVLVDVESNKGFILEADKLISLQ